MGSSQVASEKTDVTVDDAFNNHLTLPRTELASDV
jgi:hypothetical protein